MCYGSQYGVIVKECHYFNLLLMKLYIFFPTLKKSIEGKGSHINNIWIFLNSFM